MPSVELRMGRAAEAAAETLRKQGFRLATTPLSDRVPKLPGNLTDMSDEALMDQFVETTSWVDYLSVQVACAQVDERAAQKALERAQGLAMASASVSSKSVSAAKATAATDPSVVEAADDYDEKHDYRKLVETLTANLDRNAALLSRELTRRTSTPTPTKRAGRYL